MLHNRSIHLICVDESPPQALRALVRSVERVRLHVVGLDVICAECAIGCTRDALWELRNRACLPPFRSMRSDVAPASRVLGVAPDDATRAISERLRRLGAALPEGVVIAGVVGATHGGFREGLTIAMTLHARRGDVLVRASDLESIPFVRVGALELSAASRALLETCAFDDLCALTHVPPVDEMSGRLTRHARGWTYEALAGDRVIDAVPLGDAVGQALAAVVRHPNGTVHEVFEAACGLDLGWSPADRGDLGVDRVDQRVRTWLRRLRDELSDWSARGLGAFVPQRGERRVEVPVDIQFDPDLPWLSKDIDTCSQPPTSSSSSTTGSSSKPG